MSAIVISRYIGNVRVDCVIRERPTHKLGITRIPIENGSAVTDHAYMHPKQLELEFADRNAAATFSALVRLQESRKPFTLVSGLFVYRSMLVEEINPERDVSTARILRGTALISEAIIVGTAYAQGSANSMKSPGQAATPSKEIALDSLTQDRVTGIVMRGDIVSLSVDAPLASRVLGSFVR